MAGSVSFSVDIKALIDSSFPAAFKTAGAALNNLRSEQAKLGQSMDQIASYNNLLSALKADSQALRNVKNDTVELRLKLAKNANEFKALSGGAKILNRDLKSVRAEEKLLIEQGQKLETKTQNLEGKISKKREALTALGSALKSAGIDTRNLAAEQERLTQKANQAAQSQRRLEDARMRYAAARENFNFDAVKYEAGKAYMGLKAFEKPVKVAMNFESAMARVNAVAFGGVSDIKKSEQQKEQFKAMKAQAEELGASSTAAAEGIGIPEAAEIISGALNGFQLKSDQSGRVGDLLLMASVSSATDVAGLGEAMEKIAEPAQGLGMSIEQVTAMLSVLADNSIKGSEAGNALKTGFLRLTDEPAKVAEALAKLKIPLEDAQGNLRHIPGLFKEIDKATAKMGTKQRMKILADIFGKEAAPAMLALMQGAATGKLEEYEAKYSPEKIAGVSGNIANVKNDTLEGDLTKLSSAVEGLLTSVGEPMLGTVRAGVELLTEGASFLNGIAKEFPTVATSVMLTAAAVTAIKVLLAAKNIFKNGVELGSAIKNLASANAAAQTAASAGTALTTATGASAAAGTSASAVSASTASTAGFSLMKLAGPFMTAIGLAMAAIEQDKANMARRDAKLAETPERLNRFVELAQRNNIAIPQAQIKANLELLELYTSKAARPTGLGFEGESERIKALVNAFYNEREAVKPDAQAAKAEAPRMEQLQQLEIEAAQVQPLTERISEVKEVMTQELPAAEQVSEIKELAAQAQPVVNEIKELAAQNRPDITEAKARIVNINDAVTQLPPNVTEIVNDTRAVEVAVRELPERLAPYLEQLKNSQPVVINSSVTGGDIAPTSRFLSGGFAAHATGGIFSTPHLGLVAEAGTEAIIPLEDKSRGVPLWLAAGEQMGLELAGQANIANSRSYASTQNVNRPEYHFSITVNSNSTAEGAQAGRSESLELSIKRAIDAAMREAAEREAMVSFA